MHRKIDRLFNVFNDLSKNAPKELVRACQTPDVAKVQEVGPLVYGYLMTIGSDGKPRVREFGNVKASKDMYLIIGKSQISAEREPLSDITTTDKEVKVVLEMPGVNKKEDIKINAYDEKVEVKTAEDSSARKYRKIIDLPKSADIQTARSTYNNEILEVTFKKKERRRNKVKGKRDKDRVNIYPS